MDEPHQTSEVYIGIMQGKDMRLPFFRRSKDEAGAVRINKSNIQGDVIVDGVDAGNGEVGLDVVGSIVRGNITVNYNGGSEALERKMEEVLEALSKNLDTTDSTGNAPIRNDVREAREAVQLKPEVPSAIESMRSLSRILKESGYYDESHQLELDIAHLMMETDDVRTQIRGMVHLSETDMKNINWYDQLRQALRLATELESREDITLVTNAMFRCKRFGRQIEGTDRLLDDILVKISRMTPEEFLQAYPHYYPDMSGLDLWTILTHIKFSHRWRESHYRYDAKKLFLLFRKTHKGKYTRKDIRSAKLRVLYPKTNMILDTPGVILEICVGLMTLGQVSTDWTYSRWKAWTVSVLIVAGIWYW